jgi:TonB family protein
MRILFLCSMFAVAFDALALTPNLPAGTLGPGMIVQTRVGSMSNVIITAPRPVIPRIHPHTRGVYAIDLSVTTGLVYSARVLQSSGDKGVDEAVLETLRQWRFRPRSIYKLIVPIDFTRSGPILGGKR